jgi:hypothetical protein
MATLKKLTRVGADVRQIARLLQAKAPEGHMLAYITPEEAELLKSRGGSGEEHEDTGIPSFEQFYGVDEAAAGAFEPDYPLNEPPTSVSTAPVQSANQAPTTTLEPVGIQPAPPTATVEGQPPVGTYGSTQYSYPTVTPSYAPQNIGLGGAPAGTPLSTPSVPYEGYANQFAGAFPAGSFETQPGVSITPYQVDTTADRTLGDRFRDLAKGLGIQEDTLGKIGVGGLQALIGAYQANKASEQGQAAKKEQQALAAPDQAQGKELQRQAQAGELTPVGQQQLQRVQAQLAQQATARGGVGAAQSAAQVEAFRNQLLQQQYDYGIKLSGIGDQIALGAIKAGVQADQYVNQLTAAYANNIARALYGQAPAQQQTQPGAA